MSQLLQLFNLHSHAHSMFARSVIPLITMHDLIESIQLGSFTRVPIYPITARGAFRGCVNAIPSTTASTSRTNRRRLAATTTSRTRTTRDKKARNTTGISAAVMTMTNKTEQDREGRLSARISFPYRLFFSVLYKRLRR